MNGKQAIYRLNPVTCLAEQAFGMIRFQGLRPDEKREKVQIIMDNAFVFLYLSSVKPFYRKEFQWNI